MNKPFFNKICIVGVGLIGGSLGLAIKKKKIAKFVVGVVRRKQTAIEAVQKNVVDMATLNLAEGVRDADLVVLCSPVSTIIRQIKQIAPYLKKSAIVTDVGSSKVEIEKAARKYLKKNIFVGSHPMVGLAQTGVKFAAADLFQGAQCFVTSKNSRVNEFWRALGCEPVYLSAKDHDAWVARVSHMPHILSFALFQSNGARRLDRFGLKASNPSIRDLSRLSKSDPVLWADILRSNRKEILKSLAKYESSVRNLKSALVFKNPSKLERFIHAANSVSKRLAPDS